MTKDSITHKGIKYEWLGQSTVRITTGEGAVIYIDPVMLDPDPPGADLILITHHHVDHCLPEFVEQIRGPETRLAAFHPSYVKYCVQDIKGARTIKIGQTVELAGMKVIAVAAYTARGFHSKNEGCGFLIEVAGQRVYFSGDTGRIEEMEGFTGLDVAIVSICDNIYMIDPDEIIEAVKAMAPSLFIPVHYTPLDAPDPVPTEGMFSTKDPRYFTRKYDIEKLAPLFKGTGVEVVALRMLGSYDSY